jgi:DNA-binding NtrC family response regulator
MTKSSATSGNSEISRSMFFPRGLAETDRRYNGSETQKGKMPAKILVVDDDLEQRSDLAEMVQSLGFEVATATDGEDALAKLASFQPNAILTDLVMPRMDGVALLKVLAERGDLTPTIVLTGFGSVDQAISFVHDLKAFWFLEKPVQAGVMRTLLDRALQQNQLIEETQRLNRELSYRGVLDELTGESPPMKEVFSLIQQVAPTTASVFIYGESGTGKELVARAIHRLSPRSGGPFVAVNCAALPETLVESELFGHEKGAFTGAVERRAGCFEQAHNGTLLLDEIGEMPVGTQAKLLRVIEESKVRRLGGKADLPFAVRVLAATNRPPAEAIKDNHLREDLFYRLNVFNIALPPLRERKEDIPAIAAALLHDLNKKHGCRVTHLSTDVLARFSAASWPGNARELRNVIERAVILAGEGEIQLRHLPGMASSVASAATTRDSVLQTVSGDVLQIPVGARMEEVEDAYLRLTLKYTNDNKTRAAEILGLSLRTLHNRINSHSGPKIKTASAE